MSNVTLDFTGRVFATPSALTLIVDGVEIHSGQVGSGQPLDTEIDLVTMSNAAPGSTLSCTITVTSGVVTIGQVLEATDDTQPISNDLRTNILINGVAPEWPATPVDPMPGGTSENPNWTGWFFEIGAGETITFNVQTPSSEGSTWQPNTNYLAGQIVYYQQVEYTTNANCNSGPTFNPAQFTPV